MALTLLLEIGILRHARCLAPLTARAFSAEASQNVTESWPQLQSPSLTPPTFITRQSKTKADKREPLAVSEALQEVKEKARARFDESVDVRIALGTNPKRGDQMVRGAMVLPHGTGKEPRVCVFARSTDAADAAAAGADVIGDEELIARLQQQGSSAIAFDACLGTRDMMPLLAKVARVLGPRGLMPNPKLGTLIEPGGMQAAVSAMKRGRVEYRADRSAVVQAAIGKVSFPTEHLLNNFTSLTAAVLNARPKGVKGSGMSGYFLSVLLSSSMGPGIPVSLSSTLAALQARRR